MPGLRAAMTGLTILLVATDTARARAALTLASAAAALGGRIRLHAHERAVAMLLPGTDADDAMLTAAGQPPRKALIAMAIEAGVAITACQTGLAVADIAIDALAPGVEAGGLVGLLADLGDDRLVVI